MKRKKLARNTEGTAKSGIVWSLIAVLVLLVGIPVAIGSVSELQDTDVKATFHQPIEVADFNNPDVGLGTEDYHLDTGSSVYYEYGDNSTYGGLFPSGSYSELHYNEYLAEGSGTGWERLQIQANLTVEDLLQEDMTGLSLTAQFPDNGTVDFTIRAIGTDGSTDYSHDIHTEQVNVSAEMTNYYFDTEFIDIMKADSEMSDATYTAIILEMTPEAEDSELISPGDVFRFDIEYQTHTSRLASIWSVDVITMGAGIFTIIAAIFSTPWVDLRDITERFWA